MSVKAFKKGSAIGFKGQFQVAGRRVACPFRKSTLQKLEEYISDIRRNLSIALDILQLKNYKATQDGISELKLLLERINAIQISSAIRGWLMAPDFTVNHDAGCVKHHTRTGMWFINGYNFTNWLTKPNSFLRINGFAGCGKSVLCSTAIQQAFREIQ